MKIEKIQNDIKNLAEEKNFPISDKDINFLLSRILIELGEATDEYYKNGNSNEFHEEIIDIFIQTIQTMIASGVDIEKVYENKMSRNFSRDFSNHNFK